MKESFWAQDKVSSHEKLVFRSGVRFLFLFVLMDAILLNPNQCGLFSIDFCIRVISAANGPIFKIFFLPERF